jgi:hypothetical protein
MSEIFKSTGRVSIHDDGNAGIVAMALLDTTTRMSNQKTTKYYKYDPVKRCITYYPSKEESELLYNGTYNLILVPYELLESLKNDRGIYQFKLSLSDAMYTLSTWVMSDKGIKIYGKIPMLINYVIPLKEFFIDRSADVQIAPIYQGGGSENESTFD